MSERMVQLLPVGVDVRVARLARRRSRRSPCSLDLDTTRCVVRGCGRSAATCIAASRSIPNRVESSSLDASFLSACRSATASRAGAARRGDCEYDARGEHREPELGVGERSWILARPEKQRYVRCPVWRAKDVQRRVVERHALVEWSSLFSMNLS